MNRIERLDALYQTAQVWARRSTCSRLHVGCVIEREGRILVQGYNGAPAGMPHCDHSCNCELPGYPYTNEHQEEVHRSYCRALLPCTTAEHAERNAIAFAAKVGVALDGANLICTHEPCLPCAMSLVNAGIKTLYYGEPYRLHDGLEFLQLAGVKAYRVLDILKLA